MILKMMAPSIEMKFKKLSIHHSKNEFRIRIKSNPNSLFQKIH